MAFYQINYFTSTKKSNFYIFLCFSVSMKSLLTLPFKPPANSWMTFARRSVTTSLQNFWTLSRRRVWLWSLMCQGAWAVSLFPLILLRLILLLCDCAKRLVSMTSSHVRVSGFRNPWNFCLWNPESWGLESGIQLREIGIPLRIWIQNPSST